MLNVSLVPDEDEMGIPSVLCALSKGFRHTTKRNEGVMTDVDEERGQGAAASQAANLQDHAAQGREAVIDAEGDDGEAGTAAIPPLVYRGVVHQDGARTANNISGGWNCHQRPAVAHCRRCAVQHVPSEVGCAHLAVSSEREPQSLQQLLLIPLQLQQTWMYQRSQAVRQ